MTEKSYDTPCGSIHYWVSRAVEKAYTLVFLPGLTADHRLFERQLAYFAPRCPVLPRAGVGCAGAWTFLAVPAGFYPDGESTLAGGDPAAGGSAPAGTGRPVDGGICGSGFYAAVPWQGEGLCLH